MVDAGQSYLVGEHGPELVTFTNQGRVFSTAETAIAMSNSGAHAPINIHIHAADAGSIIRSKQQIAQDLGVAIDRARRRNG